MAVSRSPWQSALDRWREAGLIDETTAARIDAFERQRANGAPRLLITLIWALGGVLLVAGVLLFVAAHWDDLSPAGRFALVLLQVLAFHLAAAIVPARYGTLAIVMHAVGTAALGAGIFLAGQIFHIEEHWPAAFMLWALGAFVAWALLRDWPQLAFTAILTPIWLGGEWITLVEPYRDDPRPLTAGLTLLAVVFLAARRVAPDAEETAERRLLGWLGGLALLPCAATLSTIGVWDSGPPIPAGLVAMGWALALGLPLLLAFTLGRNGARPFPLARRAQWPLLVAAAWVVAQAWTAGATTSGAVALWHELGPYVLCLLAAAGLAAWGVRDRRAERVNLGVAGFGITVMVFYFSSVFDKLGRAFSLIGLGALFLILGWVLQRTRQRLFARFENPEEGATS